MEGGKNLALKKQILDGLRRGECNCPLLTVAKMCVKILSDANK
jgi:hypothetical protein